MMQKQVIEFAGEPVGIVVPDNNRLKFIAVKYHVHDLDEQRFDSADDVRLAIRNLVRDRNVAALV
jgi:Rps23 Pro-64 3,4-dihydroxylase Tpa1-like proline 4-hydroxylase